MAKPQFIRPSGPSHNSEAVRLGGAASATDATQRMTVKEIGKFVKFEGTDRYNLCAAGDVIEGQIISVEPAMSAGFTVGGINKFDKIYAVADGLQATPGTGTIAAGDFVVCGTVVAKGTELPNTYPRVCKATVQPGTAPADLAAAGAQINLLAKGGWRVMSLLEAGSGAVGTTIVLERVGVPGAVA